MLIKEKMFYVYSTAHPPSMTVFCACECRSEVKLPTESMEYNRWSDTDKHHGQVQIKVPAKT